MAAALDDHARCMITREKFRVRLFELRHLFVQLRAQQAGVVVNRLRQRLGLGRTLGDGRARRGFHLVPGRHQRTQRRHVRRRDVVIRQRRQIRRGQGRHVFARGLQLAVIQLVQRRERQLHLRAERHVLVPGGQRRKLVRNLQNLLFQIMLGLDLLRRHAVGDGFLHVRLVGDDFIVGDQCRHGVGHGLDAAPEGAVLRHVIRHAAEHSGNVDLILIHRLCNFSKTEPAARQQLFSTN